MSIISYACTEVADTSKKKILTPDASGYYDVVLGAFNVFNEHGAFYPLAPVKALFDGSSDLMRRIKAGQLFSEHGHPVFDSRMTRKEMVMRVMRIEEKNVSGHIKEVYLDTESMRDEGGNKIVTVFGRVRPHGPFGSALDDSLKSPDINTAFSIRSLTEDVPNPRGHTDKLVRMICTWDSVIEPGIKYATKYQNPTMEHRFSMPVEKKHIAAALNIARDLGFGMENSKRMLTEALKLYADHQLRYMRESPSSKW